ncbi:hypothetical protein IP84_16830 [beta proteobacterium AAP99]|nr:hypothetical protein IP84_16830 [beta proteobacterium AAP99]
MTPRLITLDEARRRFQVPWSLQHIRDRVSHRPGFPKPHPHSKRPKLYLETDLERFFTNVEEEQ